jgi:hypothetical protein
MYVWRTFCFAAGLLPLIFWMLLGQVPIHLEHSLPCKHLKQSSTKWCAAARNWWRGGSPRLV